MRKTKQLKKIKVQPKVEVLKRGDSMKSLGQVMSPIERMQQMSKESQLKLVRKASVQLTTRSKQLI